MLTTFWGRKAQLKAPFPLLSHLLFARVGGPAPSPPESLANAQTRRSDSGEAALSPHGGQRPTCQERHRNQQLRAGFPRQMGLVCWGIPGRGLSGAEEPGRRTGTRPGCGSAAFEFWGGGGGGRGHGRGHGHGHGHGAGRGAGRRRAPGGGVRREAGPARP